MTENDYQSQGKISLDDPINGSINKLVGGSNIQGGDNYTAFLINYDENNVAESSVKDATNATIHAVSNTNLTVSKGSGNTYYADRNFTFLNGTGKTYAEVNGSYTIFGQDGLNLTLDAFGEDGLVVNNAGNTILQASDSTAKMTVWGYPNTDASTGLLVFGGKLENNFFSGKGINVFSGGAGVNSFILFKNNCENATTLILNFNQETDYINVSQFTDKNNFMNILNDSKDINGNSMIELEGHTLVLVGILVENINIDRFSF